MNDSSTEKSEQNLEYEQDGVEEEEEEGHEKQISVQFVSETGEAPFPPFEVPRDITPAKLLLIIRAFLTEDEEKNRPYLFFVNNELFEVVGLEKIELFLRFAFRRKI